MPSSFGLPVKSADRFGALGAGFAVLNGTTSVNLTTQSTYYTVPISVETLDASNIVTLSASRFTLAAGTYTIVAGDTFNFSWSGVGRFSVSHTMRLRNITDSTNQFSNAVRGIDVEAESFNQSCLYITGVTIAAPKAYELQHTSNSFSLGGSVTEQSASVGQVFIVKVA